MMADGPFPIERLGGELPANAKRDHPLLTPETRRWIIEAVPMPR